MIASMILSDEAARAFRFCAWWTILECVMFGVLALFASGIPGGHSVLGVLTSLFSGIVGIVGAVATLLLIVGMLVHVVKFSGFSRSSKVLWIMVLILIAPLGEVIYFFAVYERRRVAPIPVEGMPATLASTIVSDKAARVFRFCVWWAVLGGVTDVVLQLYPGIEPLSLSSPWVLVTLIVSIVAVVGGFSSLLLIAGMLVHVVKCSGFSRWSKAVWIVVLIVIAPVGEMIYFFAVYERRRL